jgi:hypothetical protein
MLDYILIFILTSPLILMALYPIAIQYERGGYWQVFYLIAIPALIVDFVANVIPLSIIFWERPFHFSPTLYRTEMTFSDRLERLVTFSNWKGSTSRFIAKTLNTIAPSKVHIRNYPYTW